MIKKIFFGELGRGAFILFITINFFNFLNFLFHFSMGRLLGPVDYGVLAVLMSFVYIFGIPTETIQNIISRYSSRFNVKKENKKIKFMMFKALKKGLKLASYIFLISLPISLLLSYFLNIKFYLILLMNLFIFFSFSVPVIRGVLQGRKKFNLLGIGMVLESLLKLIFAVSLVIFGFKVFGAVAGVLIGSFSGLIFSLYFNRDIIKEKEKEVSFKEIYIESVPYIIAMLVILLMFSLDIILAKRFFSPELAGKYSVLSMLGKMIFFGTLAIGKTMFPLTSEKHDKKEDSKNLFIKSLILTTGICLIITSIYYLFPKLVILIFYGSQYVDMSPFLVYSAIALSFISLGNLSLLYGLSTKGLRKPYYLFSFLFLEILLLSLFHKNILEYILAFMVSNIIMFIGTLFFIHR